MSSETLLYIIGAGIAAIVIAGFQYFKNKKSMSTLNMLFLFLRFITVFSILLLLINPKFHQNVITLEKPELVIALDNSASVSYLKQDVKAKELINKITSDKLIRNKFNVNTYLFGSDLKRSDSISFNEKETNINQAFSKLDQIYKHNNAPTILITDGNQTYGNNYAYAYNDYKHPIYPVILGDTVSYTDLKIEQLNVNKYAYLRNKFPVEAILVYNGNTSVNSKFSITKGNTVVYSQNITFSKEKNSTVINFTLPANQVGAQVYKAHLEVLSTEKNKVNNSKNFAVEVIDQKTKIAIISDVIHPDLGAFKKSIESNEQRSVSILKSNLDISQINDYQLFILYQPNNKFKHIFEALNKNNKNRFIITGPKTDLVFLNEYAKSFEFEITGNTENYQAALNKNYTPFLVEDIDFKNLPPLFSNYSSLIPLAPYETILSKTLNGVEVNEPLLLTLEQQGRREALLLGENIWQWRAHSYVHSKSFNDFDNFINKLVQYLASNKLKSRLNIEYDAFYNGSNGIVISAEYFDKNYMFDTREMLNIIVTNSDTKRSQTFPLILKNNSYEVNLSSLPPSDYNFTVKAEGANISKSGRFTILDYNVEEQFLNADVTKLQQLASNSKGKSYFIDRANNIIEDIINDSRYQTIQKSHKNSSPLIDWSYLLAIIAICLSAEWFLRKYNGLI
ncbi:vWA domain-containing protein [Aestuariibaculum sediminum]|uniref:VWA domain-containing protein n=1 Tax=Aestuariibaculum sediminum TaxID=2770637 RepID=A0A8J6QHH1_9FLAO|nr:vWA domain-containing protein [Aestuariibaculum sediminum]MBD0831954.1 VWA domain-containing protein [Aestuariibaculum sediminum]